VELVGSLELDAAVSALGVRSRKLSNVLNGQDGCVSRALCFGRHFKPLVLVAFEVVSTKSSFKEG
jgi:hypothetical protein